MQAKIGESRLGALNAIILHSEANYQPYETNDGDREGKYPKIYSKSVKRSPERCENCPRSKLILMIFRKSY